MGGERARGPHRQPGVRRLAVALVVTVVAAFAFYVLETEPTWYERLRYPLRYEQIVVAHAENYRLEPQLVAAVIYQESKFDADAVSESGAVGLMQLLPATAQGIADRTGGSAFVVGDLYQVIPELVKQLKATSKNGSENKDLVQQN